MFFGILGHKIDSWVYILWHNRACLFVTDGIIWLSQNLSQLPSSPGSALGDNDRENFTVAK